MPFRRQSLLLLSAAACLVLGACSQPGAPSPRSVRSGADIVEAIRAAGKQDDSAIHVTPLRSPEVEALQGQAQREDDAGRYEAAAGTLDKALKLAPDAPDLLQERAELAVRLGDYVQAEKLARRSYREGAQLGSLCARNWKTVLEMRRLAEDAAGVEQARQALAECEKSGPVRL